MQLSSCDGLGDQLQRRIAVGGKGEGVKGKQERKGSITGK